MIRLLDQSAYMRAGLVATVGVSSTLGIYYLYNKGKRMEEEYTKAWERLEKEMFLVHLSAAHIIKNMVIPVLIRAGRMNPRQMSGNYLLTEPELALVSDYCAREGVLQSQMEAPRKEIFQSMKLDFSYEDFESWINLKLSNVQNLDERLMEIAIRQNRALQFVLTGMVPIEDIPTSSFPPELRVKENIMKYMLNSTKLSYNFFYSELIKLLAAGKPIKESSQDFMTISMRFNMIEKTYLYHITKGIMGGDKWHEKYNYNPLQFFYAARTHHSTDGALDNQSKAFHEAGADIFNALLVELKKPTGITSVAQLAEFKKLYNGVEGLYKKHLSSIENPPAPVVEDQKPAGGGEQAEKEQEVEGDKDKQVEEQGMEEQADQTGELTTQGATQEQEVQQTDQTGEPTPQEDEEQEQTGQADEPTQQETEETEQEQEAEQHN